MEYQKDAAITDAGKDIACSCIRGEELREHMREHLYEPEAIIAGSLESLDKKQAMLERSAKRHRKTGSKKSIPTSPSSPARSMRFATSSATAESSWYPPCSTATKTVDPTPSTAPFPPHHGKPHKNSWNATSTRTSMMTGPNRIGR